MFILFKIDILLTESSLSGIPLWLKAIYRIFGQKLRPANHICQNQHLSSFAICQKEERLSLMVAGDVNETP